MKSILDALERAKGLEVVDDQPSQKANWPPKAPELVTRASDPRESRIQETELDRTWLEARRIVAHESADLRSRSFDMLRTQVLQSMDLKNWKVLAVTSPTAACGKTLTSINLALSIARQPERSVLLVDVDLQKPQIARSLGLKCHEGVLSVLRGQSTLQAAIVQSRIGGCRFSVLPAEGIAVDSSEWMASRAMSTMLHDIRNSSSSRVVILDLPPMLSSDDVISILPQVDCVLLVTAIGTSTVSEIKQCTRYLQSSEVTRVVVNKVEEPTAKYYYGRAPLA